MEANIRGKFLGIALALASGAVIWLAMMLITGELDPTREYTFFLVGYPAALVVAGLLGFFFRQHVWTFGFAIMAAEFCIGLATAPGDRNLAPPGAIMFALMAIPLVVASLIGRFVARKTRERSSAEGNT